MDVYSLKPYVKSQTIVGGTPSGRVICRQYRDHTTSAHDLGCPYHHRSPFGRGHSTLCMEAWGTDYSCQQVQCRAIGHPCQSLIQSCCRRQVCIDATMGDLWRIQVHHRRYCLLTYTESGMSLGNSAMAGMVFSNHFTVRALCFILSRRPA